MVFLVAVSCWFSVSEMVSNFICIVDAATVAYTRCMYMYAGLYVFSLYACRGCMYVCTWQATKRQNLGHTSLAMHPLYMEMADAAVAVRICWLNMTATLSLFLLLMLLYLL